MMWVQIIWKLLSRNKDYKSYSAKPTPEIEHYLKEQPVDQEYYVTQGEMAKNSHVPGICEQHMTVGLFTSNLAPAPHGFAPHTHPTHITLFINLNLHNSYLDDTEMFPRFRIPLWMRDQLLGSIYLYDCGVVSQGQICQICHVYMKSSATREKGKSLPANYIMQSW